MSTSTRFAVTTHLLAVMALKGEEPVRSEDMAERANTNAAVIRKILTMTGRAGLTTSRLGQGGGTLLARAPDEITLLDVYDAVEEPVVFAAPRCAPDADCPVGSRIGEVLGRRTAAAEAALRESLAETTVADLVADLTTRRVRRRRT